MEGRANRLNQSGAGGPLRPTQSSMVPTCTIYIVASTSDGPNSGRHDSRPARGKLPPSALDEHPARALAVPAAGNPAPAWPCRDPAARYPDVIAAAPVPVAVGPDGPARSRRWRATVAAHRRRRAVRSARATGATRSRVSARATGAAGSARTPVTARVPRSSRAARAARAPRTSIAAGAALPWLGRPIATRCGLCGGADGGRACRERGGDEGSGTKKIATMHRGSPGRRGELATQG